MFGIEFNAEMVPNGQVGQSLLRLPACLEKPSSELVVQLHGLKISHSGFLTIFEGQAMFLVAI
ncbi:hypothetical protein EON65_30450 [archaeon]|nr:MAG: hypothetical protein EON65_30450 [archaeon]